jgi:hypothetical protein
VAILRLELPVSDQADTIYSVAIETVEGKETLRQNDLTSQATPSGRVVDLVLPAALLREDDYVVILRQMQAGGELQVVKSFPLRVITN